MLLVPISLRIQKKKCTAKEEKSCPEYNHNNARVERQIYYNPCHLKAKRSWGILCLPKEKQALLNKPNSTEDKNFVIKTPFCVFCSLLCFLLSFSPFVDLSLLDKKPFNMPLRVILILYLILLSDLSFSPA